MKISTMTAITDWEGNILTKKSFGVNSTNPANLGFVLVTALSTPYPDEKDLSAEEKLNRYELALRIRGNEELDLTSEEIVLLKKCAAKLTPVLVYGQIARILEGQATGLSSKPEVVEAKEDNPEEDKNAENTEE